MQLPNNGYIRNLCIFLVREKVYTKRIVHPRIRLMSLRRTLHAETQGAETTH
jgi:hypothetical protein